MNYKNNVEVKIDIAISSSTTTIPVTTGKGTLFGDKFPMRAVIVDYNDTGAVEKREIIDIVARSGDILSVRRAVEACPLNADASEHTKTAYPFSENAVITNTITAWTILTLEEKVENNNSDSVLKYSSHTLKGTGSPAWTKLGTFEWYEGSRINFRFLGGAGFGANDANAGACVMEAMLTIGNGYHTRNLSGFFTKIFGGSNIFTILRVSRNNENSWDIAVYHESFAHKTIVQVAHSGTRFIPSFINLSFPNVSGDTVYDIPENKWNAIPTWKTVNQQILRRDSWGQTVAIPSGWLITASFIFSNSYYQNSSIKIEYSSNWTDWQSLVDCKNNSISMILPPWFVRPGNFIYDSYATYSFFVQIF